MSSLFREQIEPPELPPYQQDFIRWLQTRRRSRAIIDTLKQHRYSEDEIRQIRGEFEKWLVPDGRMKRDQNHARNLG